MASNLIYLNFTLDDKYLSPPLNATHCSRRKGVGSSREQEDFQEVLVFMGLLKRGDKNNTETKM